MKYEQFLVRLKKTFPSFKIKRKSDSLLMKIIHWLLFIITFGKNDQFMTGFITTLGYTVYVPDNWETDYSDSSKLLVMIHEARHMAQKQEEGMILFGFKYLFWPLPIGLANSRLKAEVDAESDEIIYSHLYLRGSLFGSRFEHATKHLSSASYFWPTFSRYKVSQMLRAEILRKMKTGELSKRKYLK